MKRTIIAAALLAATTNAGAYERTDAATQTHGSCVVV